MPTLKKRINISVSRELDLALSRLAERDQVPQATKAEEMIRLGVEIEEDFIIEKVARDRYNSTKKYISHKDVWGK